MFRFRWLHNLLHYSFQVKKNTSRPKPQRRRTRPQLEPLEGRYLLSDYVVDLATDNNPVVNGGVQDKKVNDGDAGDIRYCINNARSGDTIKFNFPASTTIYLAAPLTINNKNLTIEGLIGPSGSPMYTLDGDSANRIFTIQGLSNVEIDALTLADGKTAANDPLSPNGGAIYDGGNGLKLSEDEFINNTAAGNGGAIATNRLGGGAVSPLNVNDCTFTGNIAKASGGALYANTLTANAGVIITQSTFLNNRAASNGGAIDATGDSATTLQVSNSTFTNNATNGSGLGQDGGAIYTTDTQAVNAKNLLVPTILYSTFTNNSAAQGFGGAIAYEPQDAASNFSLAYSTLTGNQALNGGAVYLNVKTSQGAVQEKIYGCLFNGNQATGTNEEGGGLAANQQTSATGSATLNVFNSTFYQNTANNGSGGGIYLFAASQDGSANLILLTSLTVTQNSAGTQGGGLFVDPDSAFSQADPAPYLQNNIFAGNSIENPASEGPDIFGTITSTGWNLTGIQDGSAPTGGWKQNLSDQVGTSAAPLNPLLDPNGPQDNGGPTQTIKLMGGSKAMGQGNWILLRNSQPEEQYDQRRGVRPQLNKGPSIGAYDPNATGVPGLGAGSGGGSGSGSGSTVASGSGSGSGSTSTSGSGASGSGSGYGSGSGSGSGSTVVSGSGSGSGSGNGGTSSSSSGSSGSGSGGGSTSTTGSGTGGSGSGGGSTSSSGSGGSSSSGGTSGSGSGSSSGSSSASSGGSGSSSGGSNGPGSGSGSGSGSSSGGSSSVGGSSGGSVSGSGSGGSVGASGTSSSIGSSVTGSGAAMGGNASGAGLYTTTSTVTVSSSNPSSNGSGSGSTSSSSSGSSGGGIDPSGSGSSSASGSGSTVASSTDSGSGSGSGSSSSS